MCAARIRTEQTDPCSGQTECASQARCSPVGDSDFTCACPQGFVDRSPELPSKPGRVCVPRVFSCDNPSLNDCDSPERAVCTDNGDTGFTCACRQGFYDISAEKAKKPGRLCKERKCGLNL